MLGGQMHSASPIKIKNQTLTKICHEFYLRTWWDYLAKSMMVMARFLWILGFFTSFFFYAFVLPFQTANFFVGEWKLWIFFGGKEVGSIFFGRIGWKDDFLRWIPPWKTMEILTCSLKINGWKMHFLLKFPFFRGHVSNFGGVVGWKKLQVGDIWSRCVLKFGRH